MNFTELNDLLAAGGDSPEHRLQTYLEYLCRNYRVGLNFHDIAGVSQINEALGRSLEPYLYHNNPFCNYLKKFEITEKTCARSKEVLCRLCRKQQSAFYGMCYMGIEELRYPIRWNGRLIAFLCVGQFCSDEPAALERLAENAHKFQLDQGEIRNRFLKTARKLDFDVQSFSVLVGMLVEYLSGLYGKFLLSSSAGGNLEQLAERHKQNYIVARTLAYVNEHFARNLSLKSLAAICYCNETYLSAIFREKTGQTLTDYIQSKRISQAKKLLDVSALSITEIAFQ